MTARIVDHDVQTVAAWQDTADNPAVCDCGTPAPVGIHAERVALWCDDCGYMQLLDAGDVDTLTTP